MLTEIYYCNNCNTSFNAKDAIITQPPNEPHFNEHHCPHCSSLDIYDISENEGQEIEPVNSDNH